MDEKLSWSAISDEEFRAEAGRRGFELATGVGSVAATGADVSVDWLSEQYDLSVAALGDLGFGEADGIPALEQVHDAIDSPSAAWLNGRRVAGHQDELVVAPSMQEIGLIGSKLKPGLIPRFDKKQGTNDKTHVLGGFWNEFGDKDSLHDNGATETWPVAVLLGDKTDPSKPGKPASAYNEPGLVYTGMRVSDQRLFLSAEHTAQTQAGRELRAATIAQIVSVNAQRRQAGQPMLDRRTLTRLVHYPDRTGMFLAYVPRVCSRGRRLWLTWSRVDEDWGYVGVRRALRIPVKT